MAPYALAVVSFACFVALYAVGVLDYKVGGRHISLEPKVQSLENSNTELKKSITALLKSLYVLSHADTPIDGPSKNQHWLIDHYLSSISHLIPDDAKAEVNRDMNVIANPPAR